MRYRLLGNSGLRVSEACLGTMTFGEEWGWGAAKDEARKVFNALVPLDPGIVSGGKGVGVTRDDGPFGAVGHAERKPTGDGVADVGELASVGLNHRLDPPGANLFCAGSAGSGGSIVLEDRLGEVSPPRPRQYAPWSKSRKR